ncbi:MAG: iron-containing alcohol dehydrogenase [Duodenibacillus sp.]|nr:iron-containing alcohol dehydrogenase [Duodenibacillus sp.]HBC69862.1 NADH-dependent alcohol dehydrogenase [Sutterella sp.]
MEAFNLYLPTQLIFGKDRLGELKDKIAPYGKKVLLTYGGGSIKKIGLYDKVLEQLEGCEVFELAGIEPNPKIESVRKGVEICKKEGIDFIVAVGGGSVIDATKNIAAGAFYDGDPWDLVLDSSKIGRTVPFFVVLTLAATGSEYDGAGVISNPETNEKLFLGAPNLFPVASFCDPTLTFTVPAWHTAAGAADIMSHTFEQYLVAEGNTVTDGLCEAMLRTVIENAPKAIANPSDYNARSELMLASSFGCCGLLAIGRTPSPWPCHGIEHEISAFTDITHGAGLAIITPRWMRYSLTEQTAPRFAQYGVRVWGLDPKAPAMETARKAIEKTAEFFVSIGIPAHLSDLGVTNEHFEEMADHLLSHWWPLTGAIRPIDKAGVLEILNASL